MAESSGYLERRDNVATRSIHDGNEPEQWQYLQMVPPINTTTVFKQVSPGKFVSEFDYGRHANPTRSVLDKCLASIERCKYALTYPSGTAAVTTVTHLLSSGDHIVCVDDLYGGTARYFIDIASRMNISTTFVDATDVGKVEKAIRDNTRMIFLETPTNPLLKIVDMRKIADLAHRRNPDILVVVDNTFLTPYFQRPLDFGVDISVCSLSKYINGHVDVIMGSTCTNDEKIQKDLAFIQKSIGTVPSPFDCYLVNRSLKTLQLRMEKHMTNAYEVAKFLETQPNIEKVIHPGLSSHPQHELARRQCFGHSGMVSVYVKGGIEEATKLTTSLKVIDLCDSLGSYGTTVVLPGIATRGMVDTKILDRSQITNNLIRISVGVENVEDIINDLKQAIEQTYSSTI